MNKGLYIVWTAQQNARDRFQESGVYYTTGAPTGESSMPILSGPDTHICLQAERWEGRSGSRMPETNSSVYAQVNPLDKRFKLFTALLET